jgi:hypothetical protein
MLAAPSCHAIVPQEAGLSRDKTARRRVHSVPLSQIAEDKLPRRHKRVSFPQVPSADRPRIRALPKLPPSRRPQNQSDLCRSGQAAGRTPARPPTGDHPRLTVPTGVGTSLPKRGGLHSQTFSCVFRQKYCLHGPLVSASIGMFKKIYVNKTKKNRFAASAAVRHKTGNFGLLDTVRGTPHRACPKAFQ